MSQHTPKELGTEKISTLLLKYAVPAVIAMTASSLYNMVDSIFIGRGVGALAISGLAVTFPIMNLSAAFGAMIGVGGATLLSVRLGQKDNEAAQNVLGNVVTLNVILGVIFAIVALLLIDPILIFFGASENTISYARDYMVIILIGNVVTHLYLGLNSVLRASGHPAKAMMATIATVIVNTILDPIFIFVLHMGIKGAATATILAQIMALIYVSVLLSNKNELIHFKRGSYKLKSRITKNIIAIGMSPFCMQVCACLVVILINNGLKNHGGDLAIGAYGINNRILFLFIMIVNGITQGMQPIAGYNYGAKKYDRVNEVLKRAIIYATAVMVVGFCACEFATEWIIGWFTSDSQLIAIAVEGMQIMVAIFPLIGFQIVVGNFFQSIGMPKKSIFMSMTRQLLFLVPMLIILPQFLGTTGVWLSMPVADLLSVAVGATMIYRFYKSGAYSNSGQI